MILAAGDTFQPRPPSSSSTGPSARRRQRAGREGGDPSSVIFDAVQRPAPATSTSSRRHRRPPPHQGQLMEELRKVRRAADREAGQVTEVLLVLDATTGQNGLTQAKQFTEAVEVTGVVLTKLDGSAKGGIVLAIQSELGIPVKLVGLGETEDDPVAFDPDDFVDALFQ